MLRETKTTVLLNAMLPFTSDRDFTTTNVVTNLPASFTILNTFS